MKPQLSIFYQLNTRNYNQDIMSGLVRFGGTFWISVQTYVDLFFKFFQQQQINEKRSLWTLVEMGSHYNLYMFLTQGELCCFFSIAVLAARLWACPLCIHIHCFLPKVVKPVFVTLVSDGLWRWGRKKKPNEWHFSKFCGVWIIGQQYELWADCLQLYS